MAATRFCPLCEQQMEAAVCPRDGVPTVASNLFSADEGHIKPGAILAGRYRIERVLGKGGMGAVYLGTQLAVNRPVAIKTLLSQLMTDQVHVKRFYQEAQASSQLTHPNIVRVFDFGIDNDTGVPYIVMEYIAGRSLRQMLQQDGPLPERVVCGILAQVASALVEAHDMDVVHRDLKPENILVRELPDGELMAKVVDFGLVKLVRGDENSTNITTTGSAIGTPLYMSPEQIMSEPIDFRSDLYSLGCILHHLLTGTPAFEANDRLTVLVKQIQDDAPDLPQQLNSGRQPSFGVIQLHAALMSKDRDHRPMSTRAVASILKLLARGQQVDVPAMLSEARKTAVESGRVSISKSLEDLGSSVPADALPSEVGHSPTARYSSAAIAPPPPKSSRYLIITLLLVLVAAGAVIGLLVSQGGDPPPADGPNRIASVQQDPTGDKTPTPTPTPEPDAGPAAKADVAAEEPAAPDAGPTQVAAAPDAQAPEADASAQAAEADAGEALAEADALAPTTPEVEAAPKVRLVSIPPGATVYRGREELGQTPLDLPVPDEGKTDSLRLKLRGYRAQRIKVGSGDAGLIEVAMKKRSTGGTTGSAGSGGKGGAGGSGGKAGSGGTRPIPVW